MISKVQLLEHNAWTAPSLAGTKLYIRDRHSIMAPGGWRGAVVISLGIVSGGERSLPKAADSFLRYSRGCGSSLMYRHPKTEGASLRQLRKSSSCSRPHSCCLLIDADLPLTPRHRAALGALKLPGTVRRIRISLPPLSFAESADPVGPFSNLGPFAGKPFVHEILRRQSNGFNSPWPCHPL